MGRTTNCLTCGIKCQGTSGYCRKHLNKIKSSRTKARLYQQKRLPKTRATALAMRLSTGAVIAPGGAELIYDHYKEPLRKVEGGFGYVGTLAQNKERTHVQCHICGYMFKSLGAHIYRIHKTPVSKYKEEFGLAATTALLADVTRDLKVESNKEHLAKPGELPLHLVEYAQRVKSGEIIHHSTKGRQYRLELHNKKGTCPDQIIEKIKDLSVKLGRTPAYEEFTSAYGGRYHYSLKLHFKTWTKAIREAGFATTREEDRRHSREDLLEFLKNFNEKYGRGPTTSDFKRGLMPAARGTYNYHFGTLNHARLEAGLPALIPLSSGRYLELPADKFYEYEIVKNSNTPRRAKTKRFQEIAYT